MSATLMQPSHDEIQREVENLRDIKRRSTLQGGPGVLILDPDLPTPGAQAAAAQASYWNPSDDSSSDSHSHEDASTPASASDDPFHLFWVPANMHPEIDPGQFRAFLKEHAHTPPEVDIVRSESFGNESLGRKKSMLSRQYRPSENDGVEDERVVPLRRNRSSLYANAGPQLTIKDLEKLDELVEEASQSRDPSKLRSVLRRSLSLNMSPSVIDNLGNAMPDSGDDADSPIIVPRPGQILRRSARTKIRKAGQTGEGAHRFNATRRGAGSKRDTPPPVPDPRSSSDFSTSDHGDVEPSHRLRLISNESLGDAPPLVRPESYSAEDFIFEAYAQDDVNEDAIKPTLPSSPQSLPRRSLSPPQPLAANEEHERTPPIQVSPPLRPALALPPLQHPLPQRASSLGTHPVPVESPSRSPSPVTSVHSDMLSPTRPEFRPIQSPTMPLSAMLQGPQGFDARREKDKDKDKRGLFKWGGGEKKGKKDQRDKERDAGFFGSLFGSKKKPEETSPIGLGHGQSGRDAAVALLGASKSSRGYVPSPSPQPQVNNYSRYPIHVERAIYRLSHIKLANPRRALYEQVLISNLMFWYLGVINKTQQPQQPQQSQQQTQRKVSTDQAPAVTDDSGPDPQKEGEEKEHALVEQAESERGEAKVAMQPQGQGQGQSPVLVQQFPQGRRGSLTKTTPITANTRRAEQPVRGPQYDMQHRAMEQEYGVAFAGARPITTTAPASGAGIGFAVQSGTGPPPGPVQMQISMSMSMSAPVPAPPASSPHSVANLHSVAPGTSPGRAAATPRQSRSPPPPLSLSMRYVQPTTPAGSSPTPTLTSSVPSLAPNSALVPVQGPVSADSRLPSRSLSATALSPMGPRLPGRKAQSAHAVLPVGARRPRTAENAVTGGGEEEDVPLALWQQHQQQQHQQHQHTLLNHQPRRR